MCCVVRVCLCACVTRGGGGCVCDKGGGGLLQETLIDLPQGEERMNEGSNNAATKQC